MVIVIHIHKFLKTLIILFIIFTFTITILIKIYFEKLLTLSKQNVTY